MCCSRLKAEFKKKNFLLGYDQPSDFTLPVCRCRSLIYVVYRVVTPVYLCAILILGLSQYGANLLVTFTYWSFILLCFASILQAGLAVVYYVKTRQSKLKPEASCKDDQLASQPLPVVHKIAWVCTNIVMVAAPALVLVYWMLLYEGGDVSVNNATVHGANAIYVLIDRLFTAMPCRLLHFWHVILYGAIYGVFTGIHYAAGGDPIYPQLDYANDPGSAVLFMCGLTLVVAPIGFVLLFLLTWAREAIWERYGCCCCCGCGDGEAQKRAHDDSANGDNDIEQTNSKNTGVNNKAFELEDPVTGANSNTGKDGTTRGNSQDIATVSVTVELGKDNPVMVEDTDKERTVTHF